MSYSGITVIVNRLSRLDNGRLLNSASKAGEFFDKQFGKYGISRENLFIQLAFNWDAKGKSLPSNTKCILALGEDSHQMLNIENTQTSLNENRGAPFYYQGIPVISSFAPQDCFDAKNYEDEFHGIGDEDEDKHDKSFGKSHGRTARKNFKFWLTKDIHKLVRISREGVEQYNPNYSIFPSIDEICDSLKAFKNHYLHIDIETDPETLDITCFSYAFECPITNKLITPIFIVPVRRWNYICSYDNPAKIFQALAVAFRDNITVTHNGHQFDIFVFAYKYRIPWGERHWDTMIASHRLFPEVEKSLGHGLSLFTDLPYHKNEGIFRPYNTILENQLWRYCGKDVFGMYLMRVRQQEYAKVINATHSIEFGNSLLPVYLTETFTGIRRDQDAARQLIETNEARIIQVQRILDCLVGRPLNVKSPKQMQKYLFNKKTEGGLGLQPMFYGKVSAKTGIASPKADEKSLLKLQVKHGLASIAVILELRKLHKQTSSLKINFWNPYGLCAEGEDEEENTETEEDSTEEIEMPI